MPRKLTKTQQKRLAEDILLKAQKLWRYHLKPVMSTKDLIAIEAIVSRTLKRIG
tara:strand:+ start:128 stop:289 length:162 start_codon:yes stop_codon:yes gene_type:complete